MGTSNQSRPGRLSERTADLNLDELVKTKQIGGSKPRGATGVGLVMGALGDRAELADSLRRREEELVAAKKRADEAEHGLLVNPKRIRPSRWANRHEASFSGDAWDAFKLEIAYSGGNIQPIKVRRIKDAVDDGVSPLFEVVFGHRRHRATLELDLPARVIVDELGDRELLLQMDRENRGRADLSGWEQGVMYEQALREGLYPSLRALAEAHGVNISAASRWMQLARLPPKVVKIFPSPLDLQVRWAKPLTDALQANPEAVLKRVDEIEAMQAKPPAAEIFQLLSSQPSGSAEATASGKVAEREIKVNDVVLGRLSFDRRGRASISLEASALAPNQADRLVSIIADFLKAK